MGLTNEVSILQPINFSNDSYMGSKKEKEKKKIKVVWKKWKNKIENIYKNLVTLTMVKIHHTKKKKKSFKNGIFD